MTTTRVPAASPRRSEDSGDAASVVNELLASGVIAVLRLTSAAQIEPAVQAIAAGGIRGLEITLTTPGAIAAIRALAHDGGELADCFIGAGSVLDANAAKEAIDAGARFVVSPVLNPEVVRVCRERHVPVMPGAFTPTEILRAWDAGASMVKLFPSSVLGPGFIRDVLAPMPWLRLMPTGGVSLDNAAEWIRAGAAAVGVGNSLADPALVASGRFDELTARASSFVARVAAARKELPS